MRAAARAVPTSTLLTCAWLAACAAAPARGPSRAEPTHGDSPANFQADASRAVDATPTPSAISGALPAIALDAVPGAEACDRGTCTIGGLGISHPESIVATFDGEVPHAVAWLERIAPGATVRFPRREGVDLLGIVVAGEASLSLEEEPATRARPAAAWTAFLLPGGGGAIRAGGNAPVLVALAGAGEPMRARPTIGDERGPRAPGAGFTLRPLGARDDVAWGGGAFHARYGFGPPESTSSSLEVLMASADAPIAEHAHADAWELVVALEADGQLRIGPLADGGARDVAVHAGSVVFVPPGVRHAWHPAGTAPFVAVQLYTPPGPEQRFRALADAGR